MITVGDKVSVVNFQGQEMAKGIVKDISTWNALTGGTGGDVCYFVRVQEWDYDSNGGRWLSRKSIRKIEE